MFQKRNPEKQILKNKLESQKLRSIKQELVNYKGGQCTKCNYKTNYASLSFHHLDSNEKDFQISGKILKQDINILKQEIAKCELLCENCHQEEHSKVNLQIQNPTKQTLKSRKIRQKLIDYKGSKCSICSYNICASSLCFHHLDESTKEFNIDARACNGYTYERLITEANKCLLLCHNCHMELHNPDLKI